jgi:Na+-translocating ferredoxin:NAD+ oxidoreductase RnfG subunit
MCNDAHSNSSRIRIGRRRESKEGTAAMMMVIAPRLTATTHKRTKKSVPYCTAVEMNVHNTSLLPQRRNNNEWAEKEIKKKKQKQRKGSVVWLWHDRAQNRPNRNKHTRARKNSQDKEKRRARKGDE